MRNGNESHSLIEQLGRLAHEYRHFKQEHDRERAGGSTRRTLAVKMQQAADRFARLLSHWVNDEQLRDDWITHLYRGGPPPDGPHIAAPPLFKGITEIGSRVEVRESADGGYNVMVDGSVEIHETVPWNLDPDMIEPITIGRHSCHELFDVPDEAVRALGRFLVTSEAEPPWPWVRALFEDGLIDQTLGLTPRGFRRLGKAIPRTIAPSSLVTIGVLAADAARARLFLLRSTGGQTSPTIDSLVEIAQTSRVDERARDAALFSDTRPGLQREGPQGPRHGVSDRRESRRMEGERRFAAQIAAEAQRLWQAHGATQVVVVASPAMLGLLRPLLSSANTRTRPGAIRELARDLTQLAAPALHDVIATHGLLPPRGRLPPRQASPGLPMM